MTILRDDVFARRRVEAEPRRQPGSAVFILALVAVGLMMLSRIHHPLIVSARAGLAEAAAPMLAVLALPLAPFRRIGSKVADYRALTVELDALRAENQKLAFWKARAQELERRLADLSALARVVDDPQTAFVSGRIISDARSPFARSVLLNAGREQGIKPGHPVIGSDGLVGRILESGAQASRVLLLTDLNSRIPVLIGPTDVRGIMIGSNGEFPRLAHLPDGIRPNAGDEVVTSGVGGLFPRGLRVGVVTELERGPAVRLHSHLETIEHVSVLFHETPAMELASEIPRMPASAGQGRRSSVPRRSGAAPDTAKP